MGLAGRIGVIMMVLFSLAWIIYMLAVFVPAFKGDIIDFSDFTVPGQALLVTSICGVSILLGWFLLKEDLKFG